MLRRLTLVALLAAALAALVPAVTALGQGEPDRGSGLAKEPEGEQEGPLEQAREESGTESPGPQRFSLPEGELRVSPDALLAATQGQKLRFTVTLDKAVPGATLYVKLPRRWVALPPSGLRATRAPVLGLGKGRARVRRSDRTVALTLERTDAGQSASFEIQDVGIPAGTYRLPFSWRDADGRRTRAGSAKVVFYARVREGPEGARFTRLSNPGIQNNATADGVEESETFIAATEGDKDRLLVGVNWSNASMAAWISGDAGHTWVSRTLPQTIDAPNKLNPESGEICCDPMAAADSLGNIWYGGLAFGNGPVPSRIVVNRVAAGGTTFRTQTTGLPARTSGTQDKPMMTIDNTPTSSTYGRLYVVWDEPSGGGVNVVMSQCNTRAGGFAQPGLCDNADNWSDPVSVTPATGSYIYADVAVGPDGRVYVTWWDYSNVNAIEGDACDPGSQTCTNTSGWGTPQTIALLDATGGDPVPFACPILAQPGGRASTTPGIDVDHSGGPENGRVYVSWSDLRTGSGAGRCAADAEPDATMLNFDSFVASAPGGALPGGTDTSPNVGTRLITDAETATTADDWFAWLAVDQTTGQAWADVYSTRLDATRKTANFFARSVTPTADPVVHTLGTLTKVSTLASNYSNTPCCSFDNDYGDYEGIAATEGVAYPVWTDNSGGDGEAFTFVSQVIAPPSAPKATTGDANPVSPTTATVAGTVDPNGQATTWWVQYGLDTSYGTETSHLSAGSARTVAPVSAGLTGLSSVTTYHYRVVANNVSGTSFGADHSFTTTGTPALPDATTDPATNVTQSTAQLHATVDPNSSPTSYHFEYGPEGGPGPDISTPTRSAGAGSDPVTVPGELIGGLTPNKTYHFKVVASNAIGGPVEGTPVLFTTLKPKPAAVTGTATGVSATGATLNASVNPNGFATSYQFKYGLVPNSNSFSAPAAPVSAGAGTTAQNVAQPVSGLAAGTVYYFRVVASNAGGTTVGANQSFQTAGAVGPLPDVTTGGASLITGASATVQGTVNPRGRPTTRRFEFGLTQSYGSQTAAEDVGSGTSSVSTSARLLFLQPNMTYHYRINANNSIGTRYGQDRTFRTGPLDVVGPKLKVSKRSLRMSAAGRLRVRVRCGKSEPETCAGRLRVYTVKRNANGQKVRVRLGSKKFKIKPGKTKRVRVKLSGKGRRLVFGKRAVRLLGIARARDLSGNLGKASARFLVRAPF